MPDRVISYVFRGSFSSLNAGLATAGKNVGELGTKLTALDRNGAKMRAGLSALGGTAGKIGLVAAAGLGAAVYAAANFDKAMSRVQAATHETADNMDLLRKAAIDAGQATVYSASEAAGAIEELAKAGVSTADILDGGLTGALNLASAGSIDVADAASIAATALTQFKLSGSDVPHVADELAAGASKAQGDVSDLGMALKQSGLVASQFGLSLDDTVGTLSAFASAGLLGSDAGTSFKQTLLSLANPSTKAAGAMEALGIQAYDAQGKFIGITKLAGQLQAALENKTQAERDSALATIFGSDAIRAANVLYTQGADGIQGWIDKTNDTGFAADTAAIKLDNLAGDLEQLKGSLETALIGAGEGSQGPLRQLVQGATDAVNAFNKLPQAGQNAATGLLAITAIVGGGLWFTSKTITGIANTRAALDGLGISASRAGGRLARIGASSGAILVAAQAIGALVNATTDLGNSVNAADVSRDLEAIGSGATTDSLDKLTGALEGVNEAGAGTVNALFAIPSVLTGIKTDFATSKETIEQFDQQLASLVESGNAEQAAAGFKAIREAAAAHGGVSDADVVKSFDAYNTALANVAAEAESTGSATGATAGATKGFGVAARQAAQGAMAEADALRNATKAMQDKTSATLAGFDAETGYRQALKDAQAQAKKSDAGIKGSTDAALENRSALSGLASAWNNQSDAVKNNVARYQESRKAFIETATAMGVPTAAAKKLANQILEIPKSRVAKVGVDGADAATQQVETLNRALSKIVSKSVTVSANIVKNGFGNLFDVGGYTGPGGKHDPAGIVHRGEFVFSKEATDGNLGFLSSLHHSLRGYADGGHVGKPLFTHEGPRWYDDAYRHNKQFAIDGPAHWDWPYQTGLSNSLNRAFEKWVIGKGVPFDMSAHITDYDMRGYFKQTRGHGWHRGSHFPDTFKTPYDTTFSHESKYATKDNPFYWHGDKLVDTRTGRVVFAAGGGTVPTTGLGYADRHPYMLADGEEVISNRYGQADRNRALLKSINAGRLADGGTAGVARSLDSRLDIAQILQQLRDMQQQLNATIKKGKHKGDDQVRGLDRQVLQLQLEAAERDLRRAKHADEREAAAAARDKAREQFKTVLGLSNSRGGLFDSLLPQDPQTVRQGVSAAIDDFKDQWLDAGGKWTKELREWAKNARKAAAEYDRVTASIDAETTKRDDLLATLDDQKSQYEALISTMKSFGDSVAQNFLTNGFNGAHTNTVEGVKDGPAAQALKAAQDELAAIRSSATGDSVTAAAQAAELISRIKDLQAAADQEADGTEVKVSGLEALRATIASDTQNALDFSKALQELKDKGLDTTGDFGGLYASLAQSGDLGTAQELASMTAAQIDELEKAYKARDDAANAAGYQAAQDVYSQQTALAYAAMQQTQASIDASTAAIELMNASLPVIADRVRAGSAAGAEALKIPIQNVRAAADRTTAAVKDLARQQAENQKKAKV